MKKLIFAIASVLITVSSYAATEYTSITLDNGLKAYLIEDHRQPIAVHMLWYDIGAADEIKAKSGLAHLFEHLMFKGTDKIPPQEFSKIIAKLGGKDNASTSSDYTNYYQTINITNLPKVMSMEADRMVNLKLLEKDFQTERQVVIQERNQRIDNSPWGRFSEKVINIFYDKHPYKIITIGIEKDLKSLTKKDALDWYDTYYAPNNSILLIVGDLTPEGFKKLVTEKYSHIKPKKVVKNKWIAEPLYKKAKRLEVKDKQIKTPIYYKIFRVPSFFANLADQKVDKSDVYNLLVLSSILGDANTGYLHEKLVLNDGIANSVSVDYSPVSKAETTFDMFLQVKDGVAIKKVEKAIDDSLKSFIDDFDNANKIELVKTTLKASQIYAKDDGMAYARILGKFLSAGGTVEEFDEFFTKIDNVTLKSIKQTAKKYLTSKQYLDAWLLPEGKK
ncbi:MAG: insulinase family protein [Proteobacteria bacterium]|nr:insulinase family protein [Pseudomonadota bacterium]